MPRTIRRLMRRIRAQGLESWSRYCAEPDGYPPAPSTKRRSSARCCDHEHQTRIIDEQFRHWLNDPAARASIERDVVPIPARDDREGFFGDRHLSYWLSGYDDLHIVRNVVPRGAFQHVLDFGGADRPIRSPRYSRRRSIDRHVSRPQCKSYCVGGKALPSVGAGGESQSLSAHPARRLERDALRRDVGVHAYRQLRIGLARGNPPRARSGRLRVHHHPLRAHLAATCRSTRHPRKAVERCAIHGALRSERTDAGRSARVQLRCRFHRA